MLTKTLLQELSLWRERLEDRGYAEGLDRLEQSDLDFLNDRLPRFEKGRLHHA